MAERLVEWLPLLGSMLGALISVVAVLGGVAVGVWMARARERGGPRQSERAGRVASPASPNGAPDASGAFSDELRAERLRLYSRVLHESGKPVEALAAAGAIEEGTPTEDPREIREAVRAVQEAPARLRALLPRVDLISSPEIAGSTYHLYRAWEACLETLRESGAPDAREADEEAFPWQEYWANAYGALHFEVVRWDAAPVYGELRNLMRSDLGLEPAAAAPTFTPDQLRARVKALASRIEDEE